jgi:hypothetical protein
MVIQNSIAVSRRPFEQQVAFGFDRGLIVCIIGAICFWAIDRFVNEARLSNLLKLLVVLI